MIIFCLKATGKSGGKSSRRGNNYNTLVSFNQNDIDVSGQILQITVFVLFNRMQIQWTNIQVMAKIPRWR